MKVYSSVFNDYVDYCNLPIIKSLQEIIKGGLYETKENEQESVKQALFKNSKANKF